MPLYPPTRGKATCCGGNCPQTQVTGNLAGDISNFDLPICTLRKPGTANPVQRRVSSPLQGSFQDLKPDWAKVGGLLQGTGSMDMVSLNELREPYKQRNKGAGEN